MIIWHEYFWNEEMLFADSIVDVRRLHLKVALMGGRTGCGWML
jgi:hypothetical protein